MKRFLLVALFLGLSVSWSESVSLLKPDVERMVDHATTIAVGEVVEVIDRSTETTSTVRVARCLKGACGGEIKTRNPGGRHLIVPGSPRFSVGSSYLILLGDGDRVVGAAMGAVPVEPGVVRAASRAAPGSSLADALRARFGLVAPSLEAARSVPNVGPYRFMGSKWKDFPIKVRLGVGAPEGAARALQAWGLPVVRGELVNPSTGFDCYPGEIRVSFNDPNREIEGTPCSSGILAMGGYCPGGPHGDDPDAIYGASIVFNDGWGDCGADKPGNAVEVLAHEVGHTNGLAHSAEADELNRGQELGLSDEVVYATMAAYAHFDGRGLPGGNLLWAYDVGAIGALYPEVTPAPTATAAPPPPTPPLGGCKGKGE